jgi:hypothetical protein
VPNGYGNSSVIDVSDSTLLTTTGPVPVTWKIIPESTFASHDVPVPVTVVEPFVTATVPVE